MRGLHQFVVRTGDVPDRATIRLSRGHPKTALCTWWRSPWRGPVAACPCVSRSSRRTRCGHSDDDMLAASGGEVRLEDLYLAVYIIEVAAGFVPAVGIGFAIGMNVLCVVELDWRTIVCDDRVQELAVRHVYGKLRPTEDVMGLLRGAAVLERQRRRQCRYTRWHPLWLRRACSGLSLP
jgi:hypothetical protein